MLYGWIRVRLYPKDHWIRSSILCRIKSLERMLSKLSNYHLCHRQKNLGTKYSACADSENTASTFYKCTWHSARSYSHQINKPIIFLILSFISHSVRWRQPNNRMINNCIHCVMAVWCVLIMMWRNKNKRLLIKKITILKENHKDKNYNKHNNKRGLLQLLSSPLLHSHSNSHNNQ